MPKSQLEDQIPGGYMLQEGCRYDIDQEKGLLK